MKLLDQLLQDVAVQAETTVPTIIHSIQPDLILLENYSMADNESYIKERRESYRPEIGKKNYSLCLSLELKLG